MSPGDSIELGQVGERTLAIIMGGGVGSRLFPLTKDRSKPAVPLAGKYRIVDIPISNCINSGIRHAYVLTQFNSASLNRHIGSAYKFDQFTSGFVEILAAQQTLDVARHHQWYEGTADAVRKNLRYFLRPQFEYFIILSGDQLYRMNFRKILRDHIDHDAALTIATLPVDREHARSFGIMQSDDDGRITRFVEKPQEDALLDELRMPAAIAGGLDLDDPDDPDRFQASMGIYVFNRKSLAKALDNDFIDFGKHVIPSVIETERVFSHVFEGYWEDIGTIGAFYQANLELVQVKPRFDFYDRSAPIFTNARFLPASKVNSAEIERAIISDGCILSDVRIVNSIIGIRSVIERGTEIHDSVVMGADYFEAPWMRADPADPNIGIGRRCHIERAIIDKNARIGDDVRISPDGKPDPFDGDNFFIRDGIVVIPKSAVIPSGTVI